MSKSQAQYSFAVIGDWHLAFTTAACLSRLGHKTLLVNPVMTPGTEWKSFPVLQLNEPGLPEMIQTSRAKGNLDYKNGIDSEWTADYVWMAVDTPVNDLDEPDVTPLEKIARAVGEHHNARSAFVISSQIPMGFSGRMEEEHGLKVIYVPENLRLGKGIETFLTADRTVIGANDPESRERLKVALQGLRTEFLLCDLVTSEMIKHATNVFLATSISFANELARIGETMGVDNQLVGQALKLDKRIGKQAYVMPGLGFAGGTLPRDLRILQKIGKEHRVNTPLVNSVLEVNESTTQALAQVLGNFLGGARGKNILVVGYTYKAETDTLRRSTSIELAKSLVAQGATVWGYDPMMNQRDLSPLQGLIRHYADWESIENLPDAVILMTPRPQFADLDWKSLARKLRPGSSASSRLNTLVFDTRAICPSERVLKAGLAYKGLWQPMISAG